MTFNVEMDWEWKKEKEVIKSSRGCIYEDNMPRTEMVAKCPPAKRMTSGYNMFSSKTLSSGTKCIHIHIICSEFEVPNVTYIYKNTYNYIIYMYIS